MVYAEFGIPWRIARKPINFYAFENAYASSQPFWGGGGGGGGVNSIFDRISCRRMPCHKHYSASITSWSGIISVASALATFPAFWESVFHSHCRPFGLRMGILRKCIIGQLLCGHNDRHLCHTQSNHFLFKVIIFLCRSLFVCLKDKGEVITSAALAFWHSTLQNSNFWSLTDPVENWLNNDMHMVGRTGMVDTFNVSLSASVIRKKRQQEREWAGGFIYTI